MAQKYRKVDPRIWTDEKFKLLAPEDKLLAVYCLTCNQCNRIGLFPISIGMASEVLGYPCHTLAVGIKRVCDTLRWRFDEATSTLFFPRWWKYNGDCGPKTMAGNVEDLHDVPQSPLIKEFEENTQYLKPAEIEVVRRVCHTHAIPMPCPSSFRGQDLDLNLKQEQYLSTGKNPAEKSAEEEKPKPPPRPRERNPLFDAIAEVTASDPTTAGSHIAKVASALGKASPPFTVADVFEFAKRFCELCSWAPPRTRPELGELQKHIGKVRAKPVAKPTPKPFDAYAGGAPMDFDAMRKGTAK